MAQPKLKLTSNARTVLEKRYLWKDPGGKTNETPERLFARVARAIAAPEGRQRRKWETRFLEMMTSCRFMPNTPTLMNAGRDGGQLSACFVLPVEDTLDGIFDALKGAAKIHQSGGGTGFSFSRLRASGSPVQSTQGVASGPVSFIRVYDVATETIKQSGVRRGANMAILRADHPDIHEFIDSKRDFRSILNFNISVGATSEFMRAVASGGEYALKDPHGGKPVRQVRGRDVFDRMVASAWACGDPGLVFLDRINLFNPTPRVGQMESTNPCVTGDTRVWVEGEGFVPIRELVGSVPRVSTRHGQEHEFRAATQVVSSGVKMVYKLSTYEGYELRLTADHRVMTDQGDVPAGELGVGDRIQLMEAPSSVREGAKDHPDGRLGELIGWLTGAGHFTNAGGGKPTTVLSFYEEDKREAAPRLLETVNELLGGTNLGLVSVESRDLETIDSLRLYGWLEEKGITRECKKRVPEFVLRGSRELVAGYLRGLFSADGSFQGTLEKGFSVRLAGNHEELLRDVQLLLLRLGIKAVLHRELIVAKASLRGFADSVGFIIARKSDALASALASSKRGPYKESYFATFSGLEELGEEEVFDLSEPCTRHFHANGILVHNCGEQPLLGYESCNLGSLNLGQYWGGGAFDWKLFRSDIHAAVRFLDNVIDVNVFPLEESRKITLRNRKIGLGVMGLADLLLMMDLPYASPEARAMGEKVMSFLDREAKRASAELAKKRGAFPNWKGSLWERLGYPKMRNATVSTVAPTGTISIIAGCSSGIEPIFAGVFYRNVLSGERLREVHPAVARALEERGLDPETVSEDEIARALGHAWSPAQSVPVEAHVRMQAVFQRHSDSSVSKTINLPESATEADVAQAYLMAYDLGCKGITVYRDRSRPEQVLEKAQSQEQTPRTDAPACPSC